MTNVNWAMVGAGDVCERKSGPPLYQVEGSNLAVVYRRNEEAGRDFVHRHGHGVFVPTLAEALEHPDVDIVYVATPHALHESQTIQALEAGKHVLVEKPMALDEAGCTRMIEAADSADRLLGVAYYRRGYPSIRKLKSLIDSETIGKVQSAAINNEFPTSHRLDLVHYLFGSVAEVGRRGVSIDPFAPERMAPLVSVTTDSGVRISMAEGWLETGMPESLMIRGDEGWIFLSDLKGGRLSIGRGSDIEELYEPGLPFTHWGTISNFVEVLSSGGSLLCDGREGRRSTVILDHLASLGESDGSVPVVYPE